MSENVRAELAMLRACYPDLEHLEEGAGYGFPRYQAPDGIWNRGEVAVCFQIPEQLPGQAPYGFHVRTRPPSQR
jgi:hypothetical protein